MGSFLRNLVCVLLCPLCSCAAHKDAVSSSDGPARIINAASPAFKDVHAAITAAKPGDTVIIPAGAATWGATERLTIDKAITVLGAGDENTLINTTYSHGSSGVTETYFAIAIVPSDPSRNPAIRLSGISFDFGSTSLGLLLRNPTSNQYVCNKIRLDHCTFQTTTGRLVLVRYGAMYGVCDNCKIRGPMDIAGYNGWTYDPYEFGSENQFYFEDCDWRSPVNGYNIWHAGNGSSRYAIRHCTIDTDNGALTSPLLDLHGNQRGAYACHGAEVYENTITGNLNADNGVFFFDIRGGKVLCYNNTLTVPGSGGIRVREEHDDHDSRSLPALHAVSRQPQHVSDTYVWGNTNNGVRKNAVDNAEHITYDGVPCPTENVHFWNQNDSFASNPSSGIGVGVLAARPSSGMKVGVGYWATDTQTLYRATSSTAWEVFYKPYPYPHPLRSSLFRSGGL